MYFSCRHLHAVLTVSNRMLTFQRFIGVKRTLKEIHSEAFLTTSLMLSWSPYSKVPKKNCKGRTCSAQSQTQHIPLQRCLHKTQHTNSQETESLNPVPSAIMGRNANTFNCFLLPIVWLTICGNNRNFFKLAEAEVIQKPIDATAMVNHYPAYFNCSTSKRPVEKYCAWIHPLGENGDRKYVYDGKITTGYENRFGVEINQSSGACNLVVWQPLISDVGRYECTDDTHSNTVVASAELLVLDGNWACKSNINPEGVFGLTQCDETITPDILQLSCSVTLSGTSFPKIEWRLNGNSITKPNDVCTIDDVKLTCNASIKASRQLEGSISICQRETDHCSHVLEVNKVLYAVADNTKREYYIGDEVTCIANASQMVVCAYKWYYDCTIQVSSSRTLKLHNPGLYRCEAECTIQNNSCKVTVMVINVSELKTSVLCFVFLTSTIVFLISTIILYIKLRRKSNLDTEVTEMISNLDQDNEVTEMISNGTSVQRSSSFNKQQNGDTARCPDESSQKTGTSSDTQKNGGGRSVHAGPIGRGTLLLRNRPGRCRQY